MRGAWRAIRVYVRCGSQISRERHAAPFFDHVLDGIAQSEEEFADRGLEDDLVSERDQEWRQGRESFVACNGTLIDIADEHGEFALGQVGFPTRSVDAVRNGF